MTATTFMRVTKPAPRAMTIGNTYYPKGAPVTICKNYAGCLKDPTDVVPKAAWEDYCDSYAIPPGEKVKIPIPVNATTMEPPCFVVLEGKNIDCLLGALDKEPQVPAPGAPILDGLASQNIDLSKPIDLTGVKVLCLHNKGTEEVCPQLCYGD